MATASSFDYVVLGAGTAAGYVARNFVKRGVNPGQLALITEEAVAPYERPALSKGFLFGKAKLPGFHTSVGGGGEAQDPEWYEKKGIKLVTSTRIIEADAASRTLKDADGNTFTANKALIVATGSNTIKLTRNPGHDLEGIYYLRNHDDAQKLHSAMGSAKSCIMVGGGYIGMECAAAMTSQGIEVTMVFPETHLMARLFTPAISSFYQKSFESNNTKFVMEALCTEFVGESGKVTGIKLKNGDVINADMVCVGVGASPCTELFEGQLEMADRPMGGIKVNSQFESSVPGVYAIGDVCAFPLKKYQRLQRVEHVTHARSSAKHLVDVLSGSSEEYEYLPHFYSRIYSHSWKFWGENDGDIFVIGGLDPKLLGIWVKDGKAMGVLLESGSDEEFDLIKEAADKQVAVDASKLTAAKSVEDALVLLKA